MKQKNIWENLHFTGEKQASAFDLLREQSKFLINATKGELNMEVTAVNGYIDENPPRLATIYTLYVVAPKLGDFRRKILTVAEYPNEGRFPVDIFSNIDGEKKIPNVLEEDFIEKIEKILTKPLVQRSIQNLFIQSRDVKNKTSIRQFVFDSENKIFEFDGNDAFEGDIINTNKSFDRTSRTTDLIYVINNEETIVSLKPSNTNPYTIEFEVFEERPFKLHFKNLEKGERIIMNYKIVDVRTFFD